MVEQSFVSCIIYYCQGLKEKNTHYFKTLVWLMSQQRLGPVELNRCGFSVGHDTNKVATEWIVNKSIHSLIPFSRQTSPPSQTRAPPAQRLQGGFGV